VRLAEISFPDLPIARQWFLFYTGDSVPRGAAATVFDFILARGGRFLPGGR
jgi:hypothetical protein